MKDKEIQLDFISKAGEEKALSEKLQLLKEHQLQHWQLFRTNHERLNNVRMKSYLIDTTKIFVLNNEERITSTSAKVDKETIKERTCFLCINHLPGEQKGIQVQENYYFLCNPFPIFDNHFTIIHKDHRKQSISKSIITLLNIAKDAGGNYALFYNGPQCGASAPDHLHFQACSKIDMPVLNQLNNITPDRNTTIENLPVKIYNSGILKFVYFDGDTVSRLVNTWERIYSNYQHYSSTEDEPLINLVTFYDKNRWHVVLFLRKKHRPDYFFKDDDRKLLISPAAVDLTGALIVPRKNDFDRIGRNIVKDIYNQVLLSKEEINRIFSF